MSPRLNALLTLALLAIALGLGNYISTRRFVRHDLTEKGLYTLSDATRTLLSQVDDAITIKAYFSENFPPALLPLRRDVLDLLSEIKAEGRGLVTVELLDPEKDGDPELVKELEKLGIGPDPVQILEKDQVQAVNVYKSIVIYHADKKEAVASLTGVQDLEYNLAVAIKKLSLEELPTVAFLGFKDAPSTFDVLAPLVPEVKKLYDLGTAVVTGGKVVDADVETLMVVRPRELSEAEAYQVDQFVMRGGKALFCVDGMDVDLRANPPEPKSLTTGLEGLLEAYGVKVEKSLVFDPSCETVSVQVRPGVRIPSLYPPFVSAVFQNLNSESPIVARISRMSFPFVAPVVLTDEARRDKVVTELVRSTPEAWVPVQPVELAPAKIARPSPSQVGQRLLAVAISGKFRSAWAGKTPPPAAPDPAAKTPPPEHRNEGESRIVVVGDSDFLSQEFMNPGGTRLFMNSLDWLTLDDSLTRIRTKSDQVRPLPQMTDEQRTRFRVVNIGLAPAVATALGIARFGMRRRRMARDARP